MPDAIATFFAAWGLSDNDARQASITSVFAPEGTYADPRTQMPLTGPDAVADYVAMFSAAAPGAIAEVASLDACDDISRATIAFKMPNGMEQLGQYFIACNAQGLITRMVGFVGTGEPA